MLVHIVMSGIWMIIIRCNKGTAGSTVSRNSDIHSSINKPEETTRQEPLHLL